MTYVPTLLGLLTALCWGSADFLSRSQSRKVGYYRTTVYMHVTTTLMIVALIPVLRPPLSFDALPTVLLLGLGVLNFFAFIFLYRAFQSGVVSVVAPVAYTYPAVTTVLAVALLGTALSFQSVLALAAIMFGVILLSARLSELRAARRAGGVSLVTGVPWAVLAAVSFGAIYVGVGYATPYLGYFVPVLLLRSAATVVGFAAAPAMKQDVRPAKDSVSLVIFVMGFLECVGFLSFNFGVSIGGASLPIIAAVSGMGGAFAASYALIFLRERLETSQILGILLAVSGVFALLYLSG